MARILSETPVALHVLAIGEFDASQLKENGVTVHQYERWLPFLGIVSLYTQLFVLALAVGYREEIDGFSNIWAHYNLGPLLLASLVLRNQVYARVFGMGTSWDRSTADQEVVLWRPRKGIDVVLKRLLNWAETRLLNRADAIYTNANSVRELLISNGANPTLFTVISQGVDTSFFRPTKGDRRDRILFVGRLSSENKRLEDAISVYTHVKSRHPSVSFAIAGNGEIQPAQQEFFERSDVHRLGYLNRPALREEYRKARVLLLTSMKEGVPNVVLEAQACGLPVVATNAGDVERILEEGGIAHPVGDVELLANSVCCTLENADEWRRLSENGRSYVETNHSFDALRDDYTHLFRNEGI